MKKLGLILISALMVLALAACGECEHTYDDACDTACNECGEVREIIHDFAAVDCDSPKICKVCGATEGEPAGHTPREDDGDCTTAVLCVNCDHVITPANAEHTAAEDDGDCTTAVLCVNCDHVITPANAEHTAAEDDGDCLTALLCENCDHVFTPANEEHTAAEDDGECTTAVLCVNCEHVCIPAGIKHVFSEAGSCSCGAVEYSYDEATNIYLVLSAKALDEAVSKAQLTGTEENPATIKLAGSFEYAGHAYDGFYATDGLLFDSGVVIFDLNGYTLTFTSIEKGNAFSLKGMTLTFIDTRGGGSVITEASKIFYYEEGSELNIMAGSFINTKDRGYGAYGYGKDAVINVYGGYIESKWLAMFPQNSRCTIYGGSFIGKDTAYEGNGQGISTILGGTFDSDEDDFSGLVAGILGFDPETGEGAYFPGGLKIYYGSVGGMLVDGAGFFDADGNQITEGLDGQTIEGDVYVRRVSAE